jgi:hypothetical protein
VAVAVAVAVAVTVVGGGALSGHFGSIFVDSFCSKKCYHEHEAIKKSYKKLKNAIRTNVMSL